MYTTESTSFKIGTAVATARSLTLTTDWKQVSDFARQKRATKRLKLSYGFTTTGAVASNCFGTVLQLGRSPAIINSPSYCSVYCGFANSLHVSVGKISLESIA